jgi:uncharacterized protein (TIGR00730 family)
VPLVWFSPSLLAISAVILASLGSRAQKAAKLHVVRSMHERKALMADLSDAFIALPGGFGTLEEFCEIVTWAQLGFHAKACGILNVQGYYSPLLAMFDHAVQERVLCVCKNFGIILVRLSSLDYVIIW